MTYCVAAKLRDGLVFLADSRTNAGVDNISSVQKLHIYQQPGDRVAVIMSAGNLAITQRVHEHFQRPAAREIFQGCGSFSGIAEALGFAVREVYREDGMSLSSHGIDFNCTFIVGGQVGSEAPRLFQVYSAGNFIEAAPEGSYLQIGEYRYGKPILDRVLVPELPLAEAAKCLLISMDSTLKSNLSVGTPLSLAVCERGALAIPRSYTLTDNHPFLQTIRGAWSEQLRTAFSSLPNPHWSEL